ncbi:MAG: metallophosphoesterase family protein [Mariniphaga sp.]|nr:metallophosphoesterase family protein [Mariniphaga sp.]
MIALISDIHGNYIALKEVLSVIDRLGIKEVYCLGDIVGYYTQVNECCEELRKRKIKCVLGNHDWYMISNTLCPRSNSANDCLRFQRNIITPSNLKWISSFPVLRKIKNLSLLHGGWNNPIDEYFVPTQEYFDAIPGHFFASGHTHKQMIKQFSEKVYCNPGSVGQPRDNNKKAAFATFDGKKFELLRVDYDIDAVCKLMKQSGFSEYYFNRLKTGAAHFGI